jgi:hypothetical protein
MATNGNGLERIFPGLANGDYRITSPFDSDYNCIAWVAGDTQHWWWPGPDLESEYWPDGVAREVTVDAFRAAFVALGYAPCANENLEAGFEKVALFADLQRKPTHAARQLSNGRWTSKLGKREDLEHALRDLAGAIYGSVALILKRPVVEIAEQSAKSVDHI